MRPAAPTPARPVVDGARIGIVQRIESAPAMLPKVTTDRASPKFVPPEARIATFDQDGTTWVEHPMYTQVMYCLERVSAVVAKKPELKNVDPFKTCARNGRA
jgi:hypothetical protein